MYMHIEYILSLKAVKAKLHTGMLVINFKNVRAISITWTL